MKKKIRVEVEADTINNLHLTFTCPLCRKSIYSKKNAIHQHGSGGNTDNRIEVRGGHCLKEHLFIPKKDYYIDFLIHITDNTKRI